MDKFKHDLQHKFDQREIQPTDEAWGKITGELATSKTSKTKSLWLWSGIAAGFIGLLVLLSPLYLSTTSVPSVVNSAEKESTSETLRPPIESLSQLQPHGIQDIQFDFSQPSLPIKIPKFELDQQPSSITTKATSLLAEIEQELEAERFSQKNLDETELLLAQARAKLSNKTDRDLMTKITAESLLAEVDLQDNTSLRDKIWKLIEVNFKELKTSLGTR
ncbi:hypothetical protein P700755_000269 [Psychroflexus torquis ATCC 700755]|uniref:Uncharacterized protein n=1 Tax=Psychroflexus torquis (strain ATCC 700755 / CIP 106069 / ACAM 623) TaxID=313595 RepID=K4I9K5_PSYTT|nr:hypothetical protein [Psychroflexus torquis]AFU67312.1 hypothetical protein P700755_000269 [Psychroflexus torquis ATCC 700755]